MTAGRARCEGLAAGLAAMSLLIAFGVFLVGVFRPTELSSPYWLRAKFLRSDTAGTVSIAVATASGCAALFLRRLRLTTTPHAARSFSPTLLATKASLQSVAAASAAVVMYLSLNTITHPATRTMRATHFLSWPTEDTLRILCLLIVGTTCAINQGLEAGRFVSV